ncbi:Asp-tRNA(Asn)/Glu-tRNA(Gln) amidotransferase subunit GatC [Glycomyces endophyticus]|uniref:Aspartyl/glutamyl-tRNA(Asn/Gln) amidotransferase subunit C n=5 Tax=Glycomyces TaxID=58113 RepID=A0A2T0UKC5_9ACTN|nr:MULTISPECIES: Asp-tRNA(Asn)/Glu-tRNA(Gln) amidotransferase subunit GatC [Glycomyces]BFF26998.1 Asp-tRNA(Asn)/Glu-tRNA(Gln) amidotransferase subunit GatC [Glycomyces mayteni]NUQ87435.1 Asp-tRNA(Asn)/Glu-tRNA(Gln) amidotransferase subunit GatC [Glycomyces artemisiae]PRY58336.1 aspartyl/glutamyl-tRNA(Asn/Gln) amidotransferase subunit C [Glycomyces artemisiae]RRS00598.1 Asp-tRNA(Asn)/Glu-tRNA(Gln) amidotransferase subunit GatC [Glycomyces terrestris]SDL75220.1 aspartyl/glutamyl-tRNA(Asn/Gln) am
MSTISREEVAHLARLARLEVTDDELDAFAGQLDVILQSMKTLAEVDTDGVQPTSHAVPLVNVFREDQPQPSLPRDAVLAGGPDTAEDRFRVPRILDEEA